MRTHDIAARSCSLGISRRARAQAALAVILLAVVGARASAAQQAFTLTFQGLLSDGGGAPLDGTFDLQLTLHADPVAESPLWSELHQDVVVTGGLVMETLGLTVPLDAAIFRSPGLWMQVEVDGEALSPRHLVSTLPSIEPQSVFVRATVPQPELDVPSGATIAFDVVLASSGPPGAVLTCASGDASSECPLDGWYFKAPLSGLYQVAFNIAVRKVQQGPTPEWFPRVRGDEGDRFDAVVESGTGTFSAYERFVLAHDRAPIDHFLDGSTVVPLAAGEALRVRFEHDHGNQTYFMRLDPAHGNTIVIQRLGPLN